MVGSGRYTGPARIEAYTITHGSRRGPRAILALRTPAGARTWASTTDPTWLATLEREDCCEREVPGTFVTMSTFPRDTLTS